MDLIFLLVLPALLWVQSWHYLGFYSSPRTLGLIAATVAVVLLAVVLFQDKLPIPPELYPEPAEAGKFLSLATSLSAFILLWAVYSALVAAVYLWGFDARSLGFYGLFVGIVSVLFAVYFFLGGDLLAGEINAVSWLLGVVAILLAILGVLLFFYLALLPAGQGEPSSSAMRASTGWVYLVTSIVVTVLAALLLLGIKASL